jgi:predicted phosphoribosyltransferase
MNGCIASHPVEARTVAERSACSLAPDAFFAVGVHYADFLPIDDDHVQRLLAEGARPRA